jgi:hypothetical protein
MKWHSAPELLPLTDFPAEPFSAEVFHPAVWKVVPVRAGQFARRRIGRTEGQPGQPKMPFDAGLARPRPGSAPDPADKPRADDQEGLTASRRSGL